MRRPRRAAKTPPRKTATPRPRRTHAERRATTRRLLIDAAIDCLHERGFSGATLQMIAARAGVSRGAVQFHFGNRDDLFLGLLDEIEILLAKSSAMSLPAKAGLSERIRHVCDHYWSVLNSRIYIAAVQVQIGTLHDPSLHPKVSRILRRAEAALDRQWVTLFSGARLPVETLVVARHLTLAALRGMAIRRLNRGRGETLVKERALLIALLEKTLRR